MSDFVYFVLLVLSDFLLIFTLAYIHKTQKKSQLITSVTAVVSLLILWCTVLIIQIFAIHNTNIPPVYFDYVVYIATCFMPIAFLFLGLTFAKTSIKFKPSYLLLGVIPVISLIVIWTNDFHHLFYVHYSTINSETVFGPYFPIHSLYTYCLLIVSIYYLIKYSIKNSGLFSRQSILIIIGTLVPLITNIIGFLGLEMTIYITPILFTITAICFSLAILKFGFLEITPIALQKVVDIMSDAYIVLDKYNSVTDFNETFLKMFHFKKEDIRGKSIFDLNKINPKFSFNSLKSLDKYLEEVQKNDKSYTFELTLNGTNNYYNVEINSIKSELSTIGTLILFKDITQHINDLNTIQDKQNMLMEKERLASLGQLIGGIAHNLKTPIMSISGAAEGLTDLVKEYDSSIDDPEVTSQDHHEIAKDMSTWIAKIKTHTEYMSDVITAVKGQAVNLYNEDEVNFTVGELLKRVNILMKHELKNAIIYLNVKMLTDENIVIAGDVNSLVQVINNMISNSIQAYNGKPNQNIDLIVEKKDNNLIISIKDYGSGIPLKVRNKLFKEMVTTKGKNGTGLGLYMSYSTTKAHFNGDIQVESEEGKGSTFKIILPIN